MKLAVLTLIVLWIAAPTAAEVVVQQQFADLQVLAASSCPEVEPLVDFQKYFSEEVIGASPDLLAQGTSTCGTARTGAAFSVTRAASSIDGNFGASSYLDAHGGGSSLLTVSLVLRVDAPTAYTLNCAGTTTETGDPHDGAMALRFTGGEIEHTTDQEPEFDQQWSGTLQPGVDYTLFLLASSTRSARDLGGGDTVFQDGETSLLASFTIQFDARVVRSGERSVGQLKSRY